jgi:hypothetical protein
MCAKPHARTPIPSQAKPSQADPLPKQKKQKKVGRLIVNMALICQPEIQVDICWFCLCKCSHRPPGKQQQWTSPLKMVNKRKQKMTRKKKMVKGTNDNQTPPRNWQNHTGGEKMEESSKDNNVQRKITGILR